MVGAPFSVLVPFFPHDADDGEQSWNRDNFPDYGSLKGRVSSRDEKALAVFRPDKRGVKGCQISLLNSSLFSAHMERSVGGEDGRWRTVFCGLCVLCG